MKRLGIEQVIKLCRPWCHHMERPINSEGWWCSYYCAETPLSGELFCLAHRPKNYKKFNET
jgi:hypothetical protein